MSSEGAEEHQTVHQELTSLGLGTTLEVPQWETVEDSSRPKSHERPDGGDAEKLEMRNGIDGLDDSETVVV
jgi:hypothetical protein